MKTPEELNTLKEELTAPKESHTVLTKEQLEQVSGGHTEVYIRCTSPYCSENQWTKVAAWGNSCWKCGRPIEVMFVGE